MEVRVSAPDVLLVDSEKLYRYMADIFVGLGLPLCDAEVVSRSLVEADLRGVRSHGVMRVPTYQKGIASGTINPRPRMKIVTDSGSTVVVDGDAAMGQVAADYSMRLTVERALDDLYHGEPVDVVADSVFAKTYPSIYLGLFRSDVSYAQLALGENYRGGSEYWFETTTDAQRDRGRREFSQLWTREVTYEALMHLSVPPPGDMGTYLLQFKTIGFNEDGTPGMATVKSASHRGLWHEVVEELSYQLAIANELDYDYADDEEWDDEGRPKIKLVVISALWWPPMETTKPKKKSKKNN